MTEEDLILGKKIITGMNNHCRLNHYKQVENVKYLLISQEEMFKICKEISLPRKYSLVEIRAMFEKSHEGLDLSMSRFRPWEYSDSLTESMYGAYEQAFDDLGLLEE